MKPPANESPETAFDREWVATIVRHAFAAMEQDLAARGKELAIEVFRLHSQAEGRPDHEAIATRLGILEPEVRNQLRVARRAFEKHLREFVRETTSSELDMIQELWDVLLNL